MLSAPAMQQGRYVARAIRADVAGKGPPAPFRYKDKGTMAVVGRGAAVANVRGLHLTGFLGWLAWLAVHLYYVVGFRNRAAVFFHWGWDYVRRDRPDPDDHDRRAGPGRRRARGLACRGSRSRPRRG